MKILALDSTAHAASVALLDNGKLIGDFYINTTLTHSQTLVPMIEDLLSNTKVLSKDIDAFAVNVGPGSFTGVRIGVSAVKGMAMALNKPCIPVSTLESMSINLSLADCTAVCVMDARCNQVYNANFNIKNSAITRLCDDRAISIDDLQVELSKINNNIILVGDGAELCYNKFCNNLENVHLAPIQLRYQNASGVALVAEKLYNNSTVVSCEQLLPLYLRLPQAQRELKKRMENKK